MTFEDFVTALEKHGTIITVNENTGTPEMIHLPSINFYGCSFNFANEGCAESRYYCGDEVYIREKEI